DPPNTDHTDTNTFFGEGLVAVYASDGDTYFLENGAIALTGTRDGTGYTFTGNDTKIDNWKTSDGPPYSRNFTVTNTTDVVYKLTLKGKGLSGTVTTTTDIQCGGSTMDCMQAPMANPNHCVTTGEVFGTEVDVDIEYVLGGGDGGGGGVP